MSSAVVIESLRRAVEAAPDDVPLRVHLAQLLLGAGHADEAIRQCGVALQHDPGSADARALLLRAMGVPGGSAGRQEAPAAPTASPAPPPPAGPQPPTTPDPPAAVAGGLGRLLRRRVRRPARVRGRPLPG